LAPGSGSGLEGVVGEIEATLYQHQAALYARIVNRFSTTGPLQTRIEELAGALALLRAFTMLGLPNALEADDYLSALLYGEQRIYDPVLVLAQYMAAEPSGMNVRQPLLTAMEERINALNAVFAAYVTPAAQERGNNVQSLVEKTLTLLKLGHRMAYQPTILFTAPPDKTVSDAPFPLEATASSGLPVSFLSTTPAICTLAGTLVTLVSTGVCTMVAAQAGDRENYPALDVAQSFLVNAPAKQPQSITFDGLADKALDDAPFAVHATASSGLPVSFRANTPEVCTVTDTRVTLVAAGVCTIAAAQAGNDVYQAATGTQSFTVRKASQMIDFAPQAERIWGDPAFEVSATASSGLPVSFISTAPAVCTVAGTTVTLLNAGVCTLVATQAGNSTYHAAADVAQSFAVNSPSKQNQFITFEPLVDKTLGDGPFAITATASSGLVVTFTSVTPNVCTSMSNLVTLVSAGICTLVAAQAGDNTYHAAADVTQSFTVNSLAKQHQSILFVSLADKLLGDPAFGVNATASSGLPVNLSSSTPNVCTVASNVVTLIALGTCTLIAAQPGDDTFNPALEVHQSFEVKDQPATTFSMFLPLVTK
jgi:hypothetical protein